MTRAACSTSRCGCMRAPGTATPNRRQCATPGPVHLGDHRPAQGRGDQPAGDRRRPRRARRGLAVDARGHPGARSAAVSCARPGARPARLAAGRKSLRAHRESRRRRPTLRPPEGALYFGVPTVWSRVVADPDAARALSLGAAAGLGQRGAAGAGVRAAGRTHRPRAGRAVRQYRIADHAEHLARRRTPPRLGRVCRWTVCRPGWSTRPAPRYRTTAKPSGDLQVRGPTLFDGYLNRPDATADVLGDDGWYRTGDVAVIDADGMHRIVGRESVDLIKSGGYRIGAGEIETALLGHPGVGEVAVVGCARRRSRPAHRRLRRRRRGTSRADRLCRAAAFGAQAAAGGAVGGRLPRNAMGKVLKKELIDMTLRFCEVCIDAADIHALGQWWADGAGLARGDHRRR